MGPDMTATTPLIQPDTAVLTLRQALAAARAAGTPILGRLGEETAATRRSDLAELIDDIDAALGLIAESLNNIDGLDEWLPDGGNSLGDALTGLEYAGAALEEIHTGLTRTAQ